VDKKTFKCMRCGFTFNAQYVACLNLFSRSNDGLVATRSRRLYLAPRKAGLVVPVDVAPNEQLSNMKWLREKPAQISKIPLGTKR
jgi:transposase